MEAFQIRCRLCPRSFTLLSCEEPRDLCQTCTESVAHRAPTVYDDERIGAHPAPSVPIRVAGDLTCGGGKRVIRSGASMR